MQCLPIFGEISRAISRAIFRAIFGRLGKRFLQLNLNLIFIGHIFCGDLWGYFWNASYFSNRIEFMYFDFFT